MFLRLRFIFLFLFAFVLLSPATIILHDTSARVIMTNKRSRRGRDNDDAILAQGARFEFVSLRASVTHPSLTPFVHSIAQRRRRPFELFHTLTH
jgi:hypothetical protein